MKPNRLRSLIVLIGIALASLVGHKLLLWGSHDAVLSLEEVYKEIDTRTQIFDDQLKSNQNALINCLNQKPVPKHLCSWNLRAIDVYITKEEQAVYWSSDNSWALEHLDFQAQWNQLLEGDYIYFYKNVDLDDYRLKVWGKETLKANVQVKSDKTYSLLLLCIGQLILFLTIFYFNLIPFQHWFLRLIITVLLIIVVDLIGAPMSLIYGYLTDAASFQEYNFIHILIYVVFFSFCLIRVFWTSNIWDKIPTLLKYLLVYLLDIFILIIGAWILRRLFLASEIELQIENIFLWDLRSLLYLSFSQLVIMVLFVLVYTSTKLIQKYPLVMHRKLIVLATACFMSLPVFFQWTSFLTPFIFYLAVVVFILLLDLFIENLSIGLTWPLIWISTFSVFSASLMYAVQLEKLNILQKEIATGEQPLMLNDMKDYVNYFQWAIYEDNVRTSANPSALYPKNWSRNWALDTFIFQDEYIHYCTIQGSEKRVVSRQSDSIYKAISLYSYMFLIWVILLFLVLMLNTQFQFLPKEWQFVWTQQPSMRRKIQFYLLAITFGLFLTITLTTYFYYDQNLLPNYYKDKMIEKLDWVETNLTDSNWRNAVIEDRQIQWFDNSGFALQDSSLLEYSVWTQLQRGDRIVFDDERPYVYAPLELFGHKGFIEFHTQNLFASPTYGLHQLFSTLVNVYIFLFVLMSGVAVFIANSITSPLKKLSYKLRRIKIGRKNKPLEWSSEDEIGFLIKEYNRIIGELDESARVLAATERETAWREMAKQIAHEVKNPLTPMKLSIQYLQMNLNNSDEVDKSLVEKVTHTMIEQIEHMNQIVSEFSNFAKMPEPENEKVILNEVVATVHDLFRKRDDMDINLYVPIDEIHVFADKNHLMRVMNNLLKNAIQAIPKDRRGIIDIELYTEAKDALIRVKDNGVGIPASMQDKVFKPNFTSKSSGTGLGLAICASIVEGFNGKIYFESQVDQGTTFFVEIPLMHTEDNFLETERVIL